jgi:hypothetical protein
MKIYFSVVDPDPHGSGTFCRIRIRKLEVSDPDPGQSSKLDGKMHKNHQNMD